MTADAAVETRLDEAPVTFVPPIVMEPPGPRIAPKTHACRMCKAPQATYDPMDLCAPCQQRQGRILHNPDNTLGIDETRMPLGEGGYMRRSLRGT